MASRRDIQIIRAEGALMLSGKSPASMLAASRNERRERILALCKPQRAIESDVLFWRAIHLKERELIDGEHRDGSPYLFAVFRQ
jgi:hypothetical protein